MRATVAHDSDLQELMRGTEVLIENSKHLCHSSARAIEKSKRLVREIEASRQGANGDTPKEPSKMNARAPLLVLTNSCPWRIRAVTRGACFWCRLWRSEGAGHFSVREASRSREYWALCLVSRGECERVRLHPTLIFAKCGAARFCHFVSEGRLRQHIRTLPDGRAGPASCICSHEGTRCPRPAVPTCWQLQ